MSNSTGPSRFRVGTSIYESEKKMIERQCIYLLYIKMSHFVD